MRVPFGIRRSISRSASDLFDADHRPWAPPSRELDRLELVLSQLSEIEAEPDAAVEQSRASSGKSGLLTRLKGIGPKIATMLQLEAFFRSFGNRREVAAMPAWPRCVEERRDSEQGSPSRQPCLRVTMVELAWL